MPQREELADTFQYTTRGGERWDNISYAVYGIVDNYEIIMRANPDVPKYDILPDGIVLEIPVLEDTTVETDDSLRPPWKR